MKRFHPALVLALGLPLACADKKSDDEKPLEPDADHGGHADHDHGEPADLPPAVGFEGRGFGVDLPGGYRIAAPAVARYVGERLGAEVELWATRGQLASINIARLPPLGFDPGDPARCADLAILDQQSSEAQNVGAPEAVTYPFGKTCRVTVSVGASGMMQRQTVAAAGGKHWMVICHYPESDAAAALADCDAVLRSFALP